MSKKAKVAEPVVDVKELNWETEDAAPAAGSEAVCVGAVIDDMPDGLKLKSVLYDCWCQVDPEIRADNPVWKFAYCDDHVSFVFRNGQKVVISL